MKHTTATLRVLFIGILLFQTLGLHAQTEEQKAMAKLSFMIGDWKGEGTSYPKAENEPYQVLSKVRYDLDGELLVLRHRSTRNDSTILALHTIMYYNKEDGFYYYNAYRRSGARPFQCQLKGDQFICEINGNYRLTFQRTENGEFNEFGQRLVDGEWVKNFEDILQPTSEVIIKDH